MKQAGTFSSNLSLTFQLGIPLNSLTWPQLPSGPPLVNLIRYQLITVPPNPTNIYCMPALMK